MIQLRPVKRLLCRVQILTTLYLFFGCLSIGKKSKNTDKNTGECAKPPEGTKGEGIVVETTAGRCFLRMSYHILIDL